MGLGCEESHLRVKFHVLDRGTGASPNLPHFRVYGSSGWASAMVFPWEPNKAYDIGYDWFHMPLKACAYRKKGMMVSPRGIERYSFRPWVACVCGTKTRGELT